ncbi:MAG: hypothetical protein R3F59_27270 [Myxococcota bacterium]
MVGHLALDDVGLVEVAGAEQVVLERGEARLGVVVFDALVVFVVRIHAVDAASAVVGVHEVLVRGVASTGHPAPRICVGT